MTPDYLDDFDDEFDDDFEDDFFDDEEDEEQEPAKVYPADNLPIHPTFSLQKLLSVFTSHAAKLCCILYHNIIL